MHRVALCIALAGTLGAAERTYQLRGHITPASSGFVSLFGATTPFHAETEADSHGHFRFRGLTAGQYTVAVFVPGAGEVRQTIDLSPATVDTKGRLDLTISVGDTPDDGSTDRAKVSTRELSIPSSAHREYEEAQKSLERRDVAAAVSHLDRAVDLAPQFAVAWNLLGTIAYQSKQFARADECFRKALAQNPGAYEPLVNLGGVLLNENQPKEALPYNRSAVRSRPHDALANSQLGMNCFLLGNLDEALKYLETAKRLDPAHFSYPQLTLARIHLLRKEPELAADELRDFLRRHPDAAESAKVREELKIIGQPR